MITNRESGTRIDEIANGIFRISINLEVDVSWYLYGISGHGCWVLSGFVRLMRVETLGLPRG